MGTKTVPMPAFAEASADAPLVAVTRIPAPILTEADIPPILSQPPPMLEPARLWTITPDMARYLIAEHERAVALNEEAGLQVTGENRRLRRAGADNYSRDITAGNWHGRNGETIKVTYTRVVADGQHRLEACIRADRAFETIVVFGVDLADQITMDIGLKRQFHDQLSMLGTPNAKALETTARWAWRWQRGARTRSGSAIPKPTELELRTFIEAAPHLAVATNWGLWAYRESERLAKPSVFSMGWLIFYAIDTLTAEVFLNAVATGDDIGGTHPAKAFRKRMAKGGRREERLTEHEQLALLITAWNAFRADRSLQELKLPNNGLTPRNFPEAR